VSDIYRTLRRDIDEALHPVGMSVHSGKFTTRIDLVMRLLKERDRLQATLDAATAERDAARNQMLDMAGEYNAMEAALNAANDLSHARAVEIDRLQDELDAANAEVERVVEINSAIAAAALDRGMRLQAELAAANTDRDRLREALKDAYFCRLSLERFEALTATPTAGGGM